MAATALLLVGCGKPAQPARLNHAPERIVSLAPNITEIIFALGLESRLVGATTYCLYPPAVDDIPKVGGFGQFSYEAIVSLNPDLVIVHDEFSADKERLDRLGIPYLATGSYYIADILAAIRTIGTACGVQPRANELIQQLNVRMTALQQVSRTRPRVLLAFGGSADGNIGQIHAFGTKCLHNELLELTGGENVLTGKLPFSILSQEAVLRLDPDIIIVLAPELETPDEEMRRWNKLTGVRAVENDRVYVLNSDYLCIPGPRFIQTMEDFAGIIRQND